MNTNSIPGLGTVHLLCKSPIALSACAYVAELGTSVEPDDLVVRFVTASSVGIYAHDGAGVHEVREIVEPHNDRVFHVTAGAVEQSSTTALISGGLPRDLWIGALVRGGGALVRGTTESIWSLALSARDLAIDVVRRRDDEREEYWTEQEPDRRKDWWDIDEDGTPADLDASLSRMCYTRARRQGMDRTAFVVEDHVLTQDTAKAICHRLKERDRVIIELRLRGWTWAAIAERFAIDPSTLSRIKQRLSLLIQAQIT